jgi:hypothetical protein
LIAGRSVLWLGLAQLISWGITYYLISIPVSPASVAVSRSMTFSCTISRIASST